MPTVHTQIHGASKSGSAGPNKHLVSLKNKEATDVFLEILLAQKIEKRRIHQIFLTLRSDPESRTATAKLVQLTATC